jgi:hypothetical protein
MNAVSIQTGIADEQEIIAVGGRSFSGRSRNALGVMARGRTIHIVDDGFKLCQSSSVRHEIFFPEKCNIATKNRCNIR